MLSAYKNSMLSAHKISEDTECKGNFMLSVHKNSEDTQH